MLAIAARGLSAVSLAAMVLAALGTAAIVCSAPEHALGKPPPGSRPLRKILLGTKSGDPINSVYPRIEPYIPAWSRSNSSPIFYCKDADGAYYMVIFSQKARLRLTAVLEFPSVKPDRGEDLAADDADSAQSKDATQKGTAPEEPLPKELPLDKAVYLIPKDKAGQPYLPAKKR